MRILNRLISLLITAGAVVVFLFLFGFIIYAGIFIFLFLGMYMLISYIRHKFIWHKYQKENEEPQIIRMGEVEIIPPQKTKRKRDF